MSAYNITLAEQLIQQNIRSQSKILDLGNCNLTDDSPELALLKDLSHIEIINLGTYYYTEKQVASANKEKPNVFSRIPITLPSSIKELYINQTNLKSIENLVQYKSLTLFDGFGNNVEVLAIPELNKNLVSLGLSNNFLTNTDSIEKLPNLRYLYLGGNKNIAFRKEIKDILPHLETLYLYSCNLSEINFLRDHLSLKKLHLNNNNIINIHVLADLYYLEEIDIEKNPITEKMPPEIVQTKRAVDIRSWIKEISIPQLLIEDSKSKNESFLDLGNCSLSDNSPELQSLSGSDHLKSLSLGTGYYDELGKYIESTNKLAQNIFTHLPGALPSQLIQLQIRNSSIQNISGVSNLKTLELLDLSSNKINKIENVETLDLLHELALHGNDIKNVEGVRFPPNLKILHLSNNYISGLEGIENCQNLEELIIYKNEIHEVYPITKLPNLKTISLLSNPITDCPSEIYTNNDVSQIKAYFEEKERSKQQAAINETSKAFFTISKEAAPDVIDVKLIILGNSNTGKTNLVHYLENNDYLNKRNSTHGLQIKRWQADINKYPQLKNVEVSIWDFGGQEYYHDAYKLFLGNNAVYVIMWSIDSDFNGKKEELLHDNEPKVSIDNFELSYWLDIVKSFREENSTTPLIVLQNKVDDPGQKRRISQDLHVEYGINESFHISLQNGVTQPDTVHARNLENFTNYLADSLHELAERNKTAQFSEDFKYIRQEVLNLSEQGKHSIFGSENDLYIEKEKFFEICKQNRPGIIPEHYPTWLHNGGALVYFEKIKSLNDRVFINPGKLSEEIYKVLNNKVLAGHGEIPVDTYTKDNQLIIDVMKSLNILYPHPAKRVTHYLAPQYLPEDHPIEDLFKIASSNAWQDSYWIRVPLFFYKKLMHHLLLTFIADDNTDARYFWKNGIIILKKSNDTNGKVILVKGLFPSEGKGIIQVSVEDNSSDLQKDIFKKILGLKIGNNNEANSGTTAPVLEKYFLEKLELSVDKTEYVRYNELKALDSPTATDPGNMLLKFKHIVPFEIKGAQPKTVFVSYSHSNTLWLAKIRNHLAGLRRSNYIKEWTDQEILAGDKWDAKIKEQIKRADIFILLLSAEFIASEYIWETELKEAIQSKKIIIPIYIESCDFTASPQIKDEKISDFEIIPKDKNSLKPISLWTNEAEALTVVAARIRQVIEEKGTNSGS